MLPAKAESQRLSGVARHCDTAAHTAKTSNMSCNEKQTVSQPLSSRRHNRSSTHTVKPALRSELSCKSERKVEKETNERRIHSAVKRNRTQIVMDDPDQIPIAKTLLKYAEDKGLMNIESHPMFWVNVLRQDTDSEWHELIEELGKKKTQTALMSKPFGEMCRLYNTRRAQGGLTELDITARKERLLRAHNRIGATTRIRASLPEGMKHVSELSQLLDLKFEPLKDKWIGWRVQQYSHKHKCPHGRWFNGWRIEGRAIVPTCDHQFESKMDREEGMCSNCNAYELYRYDRICGCYTVGCDRCKMTCYKNSSDNYHFAIRCGCPMNLIKEERLAADTALFVDGQYIYQTEAQRMERFLHMYRVSSIRSKVNTDLKFSSVCKGNKIRDIFKEEPREEDKLVIDEEEFPPLRVEPHGGISSTLSAGIEGGKKLIFTVSDKLYEFGNTILSWMKEKANNSFLMTNPKLAKIMAFFGMITTSFRDWLLDKSPFDLAMIYTALKGNMSSSIILILCEVAIRAICKLESMKDSFITSFYEDLKTFLHKWHDALPSVRREEVRYVHRTLLRWCDDETRGFPVTKSQVQDFVDHVRLPAQILNALTPMDAWGEEEWKLYTSLPTRAIAAEHHGLSNFLGIVISALPFDFHDGMFKSAALFAKNVLPIVLLTKNIAEFGGKIWNWLLKTMGWLTIDNKTWLQTELRDPESPVFVAIAACMDYKMQAMADMPSALTSQKEARQTITDLEEYLKKEKRLDPITLRLIKDLEFMLSVPLPPVARKHEPFCVKFWGPPGHGKSTNVPTLIGPILGCKTVTEFYQKTFCRGGQSEYWDGVGTRQCILYDDFGQNRAAPTDLFELILLISSAPFMANMANIVGSNPKGVSIDPKIVVVNSNTEAEYTSAVKEMSAIERRFHLSFKVTRDASGASTYSLVDGSLSRENLVPRATDMSLKTAQHFIHCAYQAFMISRATGTSKIEDEMKTDLPPLVSFDVSGRASNKIEAYDPKKVEQFFNSLRCAPVKILKGPPRTEMPASREFESSFLGEDTHSMRSFWEKKYPGNKKEEEERFYSETEDEREEGSTKSVVPHAGLSASVLMEQVLSGSMSNFMIFLFGVNLSASVAFMTDVVGGNWMNALQRMFVPVATAVASTFILFLAYKYYGTKKEEPAEVDPHSTHARGKEPAHHVRAHGGNPQAVLEVQAKLEKNLIKIIAPSGLTVHGLIVAETYVLTVEHIFVPIADTGEYVPEGSKFHVMVPGISEYIQFPFERSRMVHVKNPEAKSQIDAVIYKLPKCIPMCKSIVNKFWDGGKRLPREKGLLLKYQKTTRQQVWVETEMEGEMNVTYEQGRKSWVQRLGYASHYGESGMCGCPIMRSDGTSNSPVIGFHIAGDPHRTEFKSMFLIITRKMIEEACPSLFNLDPPSMESKHTKEVIGVEHHSLLEKTNLQLVGSLPQRIFNPTKTTLEKSLVFDKVVQHTTEPSVLHNRDPRIPEELRGTVDLYRDGINKMKAPIKLEREDLDDVVEDMKEWYWLRAAKQKPNKRKICTLYEALNSGTLKGIDLTTSPGYPFTFKGMIRKDLFVREENDEVRATARYLKQLLEDLTWIKKKQVPQWFFTTALKDERRPIDKVRIRPKTRLFTVCPIVYVILEKQFYAPFMEVLMLSDEVPYAGGVDRLGRSWHTMFARLRKTSDKGFGGDYSCYDGKLSYGLMEAATEVMESILCAFELNSSFTISEDDHVGTVECRKLQEEINGLNLTKNEVLHAVRQAGLNPTYLMQNFAFRASGTLASGRWTTQLIGTLVGEMLQRAAWNDLAPLEVRGGSFFTRFVAHSIMSDDNINAVVESALPYFNGETFSKWLADRDMTYTSADKKGEALAYQPLETISFLKNTTTQFKGFYAPLMEYSAAVEQINWVRKSAFHTPLETLEMNANGALRAVMFYGREEFDALRNKLLELAPDLRLENFNQLQAQYLGLGGFAGYQPGEITHWESINEMPKLIGSWTMEETQNQLEIDAGMTPSEQLESEVLSTQLENNMDGEIYYVQQHSGIDEQATPLDAENSHEFIQEKPIVTNPSDVATLGDPTEEARTSENAEGTILSDKGRKDTVVVAATRTLRFSAPRAELSMNDKAWDLQRMLQKWHHFADIPWTLGALFGTLLWYGDVVKDLVTTQFANSPFAAFKYFRCAGVRVKAVITASKFHQGRAIVGFSPTMVPRAANAYWRQNDIKASIERGALILDPSQGGEAELYIPFVHPKGMLGLEQDDALGQLSVLVLVPLESVSSGSQEAIIKLFFCLDQPEFKVPRVAAATFREFQEFEKERKKKLEPARVVQPLRSVQQHAGMASNKELAQVGLNEFKQEGQYVGAVRAKTSDPKTSHFGEHDTNLINWGKRYRRFTATGGSIPQNNAWFTIDVTSMAAYFWELDFFNLYRGAFNYKIIGKMNQGFEYASWTVYFEPHPSTTTAKYQAGAIDPGNTNARIIAMGSTFPIEFQVPFLMHSATALHSARKYRMGTQAVNQYLEAGVIFINIKGAYAAGSADLTFYVALSDEFAVGAFDGAPKYAFNNALPWGDLYSREEIKKQEVKEEREKKKEEDESDSSLEVIPDRRIRKVRQHGLLDGAFSGIKKELTNIVTKTLPQEVVSTAMSMLDKPAVSAPEEVVKDRRIGSLNYAVGADRIDKLALHPSRQQLSDAEHFGCQENQADMRSLFKRPSLLAQFNWSVENRVGDLLATFQVGPTIDFTIQRLDEPFSPSIMCAVAKHFKYWRGGITFIFDVVCTNFHEGKLDFTFHPNSGVVPADYSSRLTQYTVSTTIRATENRIALTVPYLGEEPYKRVRFGHPTSEPSAVEPPPSVAMFESGVLGVSVGAALRVPDTVPGKITILVYVLPATDFELQEPTMDGMALVTRFDI